MQDVSEVCASRVPTKQEDDLGTSTAERIKRLADLARILEFEVSASKAALATSVEQIVASNSEERAMESNVAQLEEDLAGLASKPWDDEMPKAFQIKVFERLKASAAFKFENAAAQVRVAEAEVEGIEAKMEMQKRQLAVVIEEASQLKFGGRPSGFHPWPMFYPQLRDEDVFVSYVAVTTCTLCSSGFPNFDIIVAPCMHVYHPWCAFVVFGRGDRCALKMCQAAVHPSWHQSFGWGNPSEELLKEAAQIDLDGGIQQLMHDREESVKNHQRVLGTGSQYVTIGDNRL